MNSIALLSALLAGALALPAFPADGVREYSNVKPEIIPNEWIVVLNLNSPTKALERMADAAEDIGAQLMYTYDMGPDFRGYAIKPDPERDMATFNHIYLMAQLNNTGDVALIEPNTKLSHYGFEAFNSTDELKKEKTDLYGLHRISHKTKGSKGSYEHLYHESAGEDTWAYIIDTGINVSHQEFEGRAVVGVDYTKEDNNIDGSGHGTHVAGTVASKTYGLAKKANLVAVKVLDKDGSGTMAGVIKGIEWAVNDATNKKRIGKAVANLSLGGLRQPGEDDANMRACRAAVWAGLFLSVAAGNSGRPASWYTPAAEPLVCTVSAIDEENKFAKFSNHGKVVDLSAPGVAIKSAWNDGETKTISGTSMAAPHVAGLAAYLLAHEGERNATDLCDRINELSIKGQIKEMPYLSYTNNYIAYNGAEN